MPDSRTLPWLGAGPAATPSARRSHPSRRRSFPTRRMRRIAAALLVGLAAWLAVRVVAPPPPPNTVVLLAADRPAGHILTDADLTGVHVEDALLPAGAVSSADQVSGRRLAHAVPARTILTDTAVATARDLTAAERAVHVPVADPGAVVMTRPGDRIDLVEGAGGTVVAADVRVLAVDDPGTDDGGHGLLVAAPAAALSRVVPAMSPGGQGITPVLRTSGRGDR